MRNRIIAAVFALLCVVGIAAAVQESQSDKQKWFYVVGLLPLMLLALRYSIGTPADPEAALGHFRSRPDNLAHWKVDADRWRAFMELNEQLNSDPYGGYFLPHKSIDPNNGVEVVVGQRGVLIGDEIHSLDGALYVRQMPSPPTLLFEWATTPAADTGSSYTQVARVPIGAGAEGAAARVRDHFARIGGEKIKRWQDRAPYRRNVCLVAMTIALAALVLLIYLGGGDVERLGWPGQIGAGIAMFTAVIAFPAALLLHGVVLRQRPNTNWARRGRNLCLIGGLILLGIGCIGLLLRGEWKGAWQIVVVIVSLIGLLGGPGALLIAWALHVRYRGG